MGFEGHFAIGAGRCRPLTALDVHARYAPGRFARADENPRPSGPAGSGSPIASSATTGHPGGSAGSADAGRGPGGAVRASGAGTAGRTTRRPGEGRAVPPDPAGVVSPLRHLPGRATCPRRFGAWREVYNARRSHEALGLGVPAGRYRPSGRSDPAVLPALEYHPRDAVRTVQLGGVIDFRGRTWQVGAALVTKPVAVRPTTEDGRFEVCFGTAPVADQPPGEH